jgi:serine/threonine protein kinase
MMLTLSIIRPANILLSHKNIPVLVDFGFAELKDPEDDTSFHSNLTYGTPEVSIIVCFI